MQSEPFELSGNSGRAWLLAPIGIAAAAGSAFVYAWINVYSPVAGYISLLFVAMLAAGAVLPLAWAGRFLKVRSVMQMRIAGVVTGIAAVYCAWAFFAWVMLIRAGVEGAPTAWQWLQSPAAIGQFAADLSEEGWFSIGTSLTPSGAVLWAMWAIEAAIVVGAGYLWAPRRIVGRGFCEDCSVWMADEPPLMVPADEGGLVKKVQSGGLAGIDAVQPPGARAARWLRLGRQRCPTCQDGAVYRVDHLKTVKTDKGTKTEANEVVPLSWLRAAEAEQFARVDGLLHAADAARMAAVAKQPVAEA